MAQFGRSYPPEEAGQSEQLNYDTDPYHVVCAGCGSNWYVEPNKDKPFNILDSSTYLDNTNCPYCNPDRFTRIQNIEYEEQDYSYEQYWSD